MDSPGCIEQRATLHQAFEFWNAVARFKPSEESLAERKALYRLRYDAIKDSLSVADFLDNPQYKKFLQFYLVFSGTCWILFHSTTQSLGIEKFQAQKCV